MESSFPSFQFFFFSRRCCIFPSPTYSPLHRHSQEINFGHRPLPRLLQRVVQDPDDETPPTSTLLPLRPFPAVAALLQRSPPPPPPLSLLLRRRGPRHQPPSPPPAVAQLTWQQLHRHIKIRDGDTE
ncbi:unnamed protein product [Linum trigynum]|uniref:Uncharacterized protein n=1 Tax=Linum trigynum TaxID=586398 RepID=A0AAV2EZY4_9ROSI